MNWTPKGAEEEVNQDMAGGEQWRKQACNMGKYCQESSGWQAIMNAGDALWNDRMMKNTYFTFNAYNNVGTKSLTLFIHSIYSYEFSPT